MDDYKGNELNEYLNLLFWTETASEAEIHGAMSLATGVTKADLIMAVQCMIDSDRPGLALYFPELVTNRVSLVNLREHHSPLAKAMDLLAESLNLRVQNPSYPLKGYGQVLGCIAKLQYLGEITPAQRELLISELANVKRAGFRLDNGGWAKLKPN
ncbi:hypothetical protein [Pseudomonas carnis]|jgi:hypothetical protein|uniref:hypothetical protein n=1 Tax=Pseudomonas carnis TaxID=2487355 RepID=UPI001DFED215|nr:hypothetical protein [Pseudomonas carnis]CAH0274569.1 hypothetical protein SRABI111_03777 [Pseudomonas carnis]CAH0323225.1 hypothetical protein SRABI08_05625 [Pseudomonas carnis]CAH0324651.1 hypothetical protein SRABI110_05991 [Pseudomonas carnis]CAH0325755.1 hypothetical protein SRABI64_06015 [Pseudomonas carnis]